MPKPPAIPGLGHAMKKKITRREQFLAGMDAVVPWARLKSLIEPHHPKVAPNGGRLGSQAPLLLQVGPYGTARCALPTTGAESVTDGQVWAS